MTQLLTNAKMLVSGAPGTGARVDLSGAYDNGQIFEAAGITNGARFLFDIVSGDGLQNSELGQGTYIDTANGGPAFTRDSVALSTNSNQKINVEAGAFVQATALVDDVLDPYRGIMQGNLAFNPALQGLRITADMSNTVIGSRFGFQSSIANGKTAVEAFPNGTSNQSEFNAESDQGGGGWAAQLAIIGSETRLSNVSRGTNPAGTLSLWAGGVRHARMDGAGGTSFDGAVSGQTPAAGDNSTKFSTTAFVAAAIAALVNSAPATLDTLSEIAAQLQSDESAATALANTVAGKLAIAGGAMTGMLTLATGTNALAPLKFVAGPVLTNPAAGAVEFDGTSLYYTDSTLARRTLVKASSLATVATSGSAADLVGNLSVSRLSGGTNASATTFWRGDNSWASAVTSVGLSLPTGIFNVTNSPVTASGTLTATYVNQNANTVFAGPSSGAAAAPAFRALVASDIPTLAYLASAGGTLTGALTIANASPQKVWQNTSAAVDSKYWRQWVSGNGFYFDIYNDVNSQNAIWLTVMRSANTISSISFAVTPTAPTMATADNSTALATTAWVRANAASYGGSSTITTVGTVTNGIWNATAVGLGFGGTGQTTARTARGSGGLNVESATSRGSGNYTILATDRWVYTSLSFAGGTWTLPAANSVNPGGMIVIDDLAGGLSPTNALIVVRSGTDTVNSVSSVTLNVANSRLVLYSDGVSKWSAQVLPPVGTAAGNIVQLDPTGGGGLTIGATTRATGAFSTLGVGVAAPVSTRAGAELGVGSQWGSANYGCNLLISGGRNNGIGLLDAGGGNPFCISNNGGQFKISVMPAPGNTTTAPSDVLIIDQSRNFYPAADNTIALGVSVSRWSTVYAGTGSINTSDARIKTNVSPLTDAELSAARDMASEPGTYKFLASVAEKGDKARCHIGLTVQRAIEIMQSHGLDPFAYGFICYDSWQAEPATTDEEGSVLSLGRPAGDIYSFRPDELTFFILRGLAARLSALEARAS